MSNQFYDFNDLGFYSFPCQTTEKKCSTFRRVAGFSDLHGISQSLKVSNEH